MLQSEKPMRAPIIALLAIHPSTQKTRGGYSIAGVLFSIIYPTVRGPAANSPIDRLGELLGTVLIPAVFVATYCLSFYLEGRRRK
jgi:hypothetical protein